MKKIDKAMDDMPERIKKYRQEMAALKPTPGIVTLVKRYVIYAPEACFTFSRRVCALQVREEVITKITIAMHILTIIAHILAFKTALH